MIQDRLNKPQATHKVSRAKNGVIGEKKGIFSSVFSCFSNIKFTFGKCLGLSVLPL